MALTTVVAYDVTNDARRSRLAALLQQYGDRIQRSVFILTLPTADLAALETEMRALVRLTEDSVYVLRQCGTCWEARVCIGQAHPPEPGLYWGVL